VLPGFPSNYHFILHAKFEIPQAWLDAGVTHGINDIKINGNPIAHASQMLQTFRVALFPLLLEARVEPPQPCVVNLDTSTTPAARAFPQQIMFANLWDAYYGTSVPNPRNTPMNLASNTIIVAPRIDQGWRGTELALTGSSFVSDGDALPNVEFVLPGSDEADPAITVSVTRLQSVTYAIPGNSEPGPQQLLRLTIDVGPEAQLGQRDVRVTNPGQEPAQAAKFFLWVEPAEV